MKNVKYLDELVVRFFGSFADMAELKLKYKTLAIANHPDKGGSEEQMKLINMAFDHAADNLTRFANPDKDEAFYTAEAAINEAVRQALEKIIHLPGIEIEICGAWIWVSGDTYAVKDQLKAAGFKWASKKKQWYFAGRPSSGRGGWDMEEIRAAHGSLKVQSRTPYAFAA